MTHVRPRAHRGAAALLVLGSAAALAAQEDQSAAGDFYGRVVHEINLPPSVDADQVLRNLKTKVGRKLNAAELEEDLQYLWSLLKLRTRKVTGRAVGTDRVALTFYLIESPVYDQVLFKGMEHLTETEARQIGNLQGGRISEDVAERMRRKLLARYRQDGYYFAHIEFRVDREARTLSLLVDEGERVSVRQVYFRGNAAYPASTVFGYGENLVGSAKLQVRPGLFTGTYLSVDKLEEDVQQLELFYRRRGYLNAEVHMEQLNFSADRSEVDITYRVHEGERFKISAIELQIRRAPEGAGEERPPRYSEADLRPELKLEVGDYYDAQRVELDRLALERFYGKRGYPSRRYFEQQQSDVFVVGEPQLLFDLDKPELKLLFSLIEGEPKRLRRVGIHGNTATQDRVVRSRVKLLPGDLLDTTLIDRSRQLLDRTRYFFDPATYSEVTLRLTPVQGSEGEADLDIYLQEGRTGSFTWGASVSSGTGVQGNFQFNKRNFDITRLPSSWNPGTWFSEIASGEAFHGAGQSLDLMLAPGTERSFFRISWTDPDIFRQHMDTIGLRVDGYKTIRALDTYTIDRLGAAVGLSRIFDETASVTATLRNENVRINNIDDNAPVVVYENEGRSDIRGLRLTLRLADLDNPLHPRSGYNFSTYAELAGGPLGADEDFYRLGASLEAYRPFYTDALERKHVIYSKLRFDHAEVYGDSDDLYPSERLYMGGGDLRGFEPRRAGPSQFGAPVGGKARLLGTLEYQFPLVSTQLEGTFRHTEIIRGVIFTDAGKLGLSLHDDTFDDLRVTAGFGVRIQVPVLQVPIQLDLGWPLMAEDTDREEQLFFSFRQF